MEVHKLPELNSPFLNDYLEMVEYTESPRLFHIWNALACIGACLGRRVYLPFGPFTIFANQYIILIGNPGTRKSSAMSIATKILKESTSIRFAPEDTAGQRQGLIAALEGEQISKEMLNEIDLLDRDKSLAALTLEDYNQVDNTEYAKMNDIAVEDKHILFAASTEFGQFIGQNNTQLLNFLTVMWDGEDFTYRIKQESSILKNPLLNLIACCTPTTIANHLPAAAVGQGFMSRLILVFGARKYRSIPRPPPLRKDKVRLIQQAFDVAYNELSGKILETKEAKSYSETLYEYPLEISDSRFVYYKERRYTHLLKLGMILAASRGSKEIVKDDYVEAHRLLRATELGMPDALGEFGLSPIAHVKQRILEFCRGLDSPVPIDFLRHAFHRDARPIDIMEAINDLVNAGQLVSETVDNNRVLITAKRKRDEIEDKILSLLTER